MEDAVYNFAFVSSSFIYSFCHKYPKRVYRIYDYSINNVWRQTFFFFLPLSPYLLFVVFLHAEKPIQTISQYEKFI